MPIINCDIITLDVNSLKLYFPDYKYKPLNKYLRNLIGVLTMLLDREVMPFDNFDYY